MMLVVAALLSVVMGLTLGLLGGGGSILAVPILRYVVGAEAKEAIATSLLVVGATSVSCTINHARAGNVKWRTGFAFGLFAMGGAYPGGLLAKYFPGPLLLVLFALVMVAAGVAMIRGRKESGTVRPASLVKAAAQGLLVGFVTGLVGAGGGFLVVPALVLFGGVDMRSAVGTSALVIAMNSFAGFAGYASHVSIDGTVAALVIGFAVAGSFLGAALVRRVDPTRLKSAFGWFVLAMAALMLYREAMPEVLQAVFVERWPFWVGGIAIGLFVIAFLLATGKALGVSTGFYDACGAVTDPSARKSWRIPFLVGIVGGGLLAVLLGGGFEPTTAMGMFDTLISSSLLVKVPVFLLGGVLIGFGARLAGGCTSGHGIVGMALLAPSSLIATASFMLSGFVVTNLLLGAIGGAS